jgi:hypothetical protein
MSFTLAECPTSALNCGTQGSSVAIQITGFALKVLKVLQALLGHSHRLLRLLPQVQSPNYAQNLILSFRFVL